MRVRHPIRMDTAARPYTVSLSVSKSIRTRALPSFTRRARVRQPEGPQGGVGLSVDQGGVPRVGGSGGELQLQPVHPQAPPHPARRIQNHRQQRLGVLQRSSRTPDEG